MCVCVCSLCFSVSVDVFVFDRIFFTGEGQGIATVVAFEEIAQRELGQGLPLVLSLSLGSLAFDACDALCKGVASSSAFNYSQCHDYMQKQRQVRMLLRAAKRRATCNGVCA